MVHWSIVIAGAALAVQTATRLNVLARAGMEKGNVLQPAAMSVSSEGSFAVSDAPFAQERP